MNPTMPQLPTQAAPVNAPAQMPQAEAGAQDNGPLSLFGSQNPLFATMQSVRDGQGRDGAVTGLKEYMTNRMMWGEGGNPYAQAAQMGPNYGRDTATGMTGGIFDILRRNKQTNYGDNYSEQGVRDWTNYYNQQRGVTRMAAGGMVPEQARINDKDIISNAMAAIRGDLPKQESAMALAMFLRTYGEDELRKLVQQIRGGDPVTAGDSEGQVQGPGDGMSDMVPAEMDTGQQDVLLSDGEYIVPADVVSGLGNGSSDAGSQELDDMATRVRKERTGKASQPKAVNTGGLLPA